MDEIGFCVSDMELDNRFVSYYTTYQTGFTIRMYFLGRVAGSTLILENCTWNVDEKKLGQEFDLRSK